MGGFRFLTLFLFCAAQALSMDFALGEAREQAQAQQNQQVPSDGKDFAGFHVVPQGVYFTSLQGTDPADGGDKFKVLNPDGKLGFRFVPQGLEIRIYNKEGSATQFKIFFDHSEMEQRKIMAQDPVKMSMIQQSYQIADRQAPFALAEMLSSETNQKSPLFLVIKREKRIGFVHNDFDSDSIDFIALEMPLKKVNEITVPPMLPWTNLAVKVVHEPAVQGFIQMSNAVEVQQAQLQASLQQQKLQQKKVQMNQGAQAGTQFQRNSNGKNSSMGKLKIAQHADSGGQLVCQKVF